MNYKQILFFSGKVSLATLISRILGFLRDVLIARALGAGMYADIFFAAFSVPSIFRRIFTDGALNSSFIPIYKNIKSVNTKTTPEKFSGSVSVMIIIFFLILSVIGFYFSDQIVQILFPGFMSSNKKFLLTSALLKIMFPFLFFISLWGISSSILNANKFFFIPAIAPAFQNLTMIVVLVLFLGSSYERILFYLSWAVLIGGFIQFFIQLPVLYKNKIFPVFTNSFRTPEIKNFLLMVGPTALSIGVLQINVLVDRVLASFLSVGSISYLYYANRLVQFPHALISIAVTTVAFPLLSEEKGEDRSSHSEETLSKSSEILLSVAIPASIGLIILANPIIELLFQRGEFTSNDVLSSARTLQAYSFGIVFFGINRLIVSAYHAALDAKYPMKCAYYTLFANIIFSLLLVYPFGYIGIAFATSMSSFLNFLLLTRGTSVLKNRVNLPNYL
ncbi:MAG: murein biosynthesis integral membrane protein MurJ, partial [Nitrospinota bacterium]|nr:murein biosynthesis integral membrane protein MurJ [Nitrospinota bacterium]